MVRRYYTLYDRLLNYGKLEQAFMKVREADGAPGIDEQTIEEFEQELNKNLTNLLKELREKSYQPQPVREVEIPKPGGGKRKLGIPTVRCRVVQQALLSILQPIFEKEFHPSSYAYRPGRNQHQAIAKATLFMNHYSLDHVVSIDIAKCFDTLDHRLILQRFHRRIVDGSILNLLKQFLQSGVMDDEGWRATEEGSPQGGVISPLIANIYLDMLDQFMKDRGHRIVRYADDIQVFKQTRSAAKNAFKQAKGFIEKEQRLKVNEKKSKIVHASEGVDFLGVKIYPTHTSIQENRIARFKRKVKAKTKRNSSKSMDEVVEEVNRVTRGFVNYYRVANCKGKLTKLMRWVRRRLRAKQLRSWKTKKKLKRRMRQLGHNAPSTCLRMNAWASSTSKLAHKAIPNSYLHHELKLFDMAAVPTGIPVLLPEGIKVDMSRIRGP